MRLNTFPTLGVWIFFENCPRWFTKGYDFLLCLIFQWGGSPSRGIWTNYQAKKISPINLQKGAFCNSPKLTRILTPRNPSFQHKYNQLRLLQRRTHTIPGRRKQPPQIHNVIYYSPLTFLTWKIGGKNSIQFLKG